MNKFFNKEADIVRWLESRQIFGYRLKSDKKYGYTVDMSRDILLMGQDFEFIPVKFDKVAGKFDCSGNRLTSLEFAPNVVGGRFDCDNNLLRTLEGAPKIINKGFNCFHNKLLSLKGCPEKIGLSFDCSNNELRNLRWCPSEINGTFSCNNNKLESLEYCPTTMGGQVFNKFFCENNPGLGYIQDITDFNEIFQEHLRQKEILKLNRKMNNELVEKNTVPAKMKL